MYAYIQGTLIQATPSQVIIDAHGIGYHLSIPFNNFAKLPALKQPVLLYTSFIVREDSMRLFGFLTSHEKELFEELINVSGVGPKMALGLVGHMDVYDLQTAIQQGQTQHICKIPGIGKKTAERLIVELRDKIKSTPPKAALSRGVQEDAASALLNLGYNASQIQKALKVAMDKLGPEPELATLITSVLRVI